MDFWSGMSFEQDGVKYYIPALDGTEIFNDGFAKGKAKGLEQIWNTVSNNWTRVQWQYAFDGWNMEKLEPPVKIAPNKGTAVRIFANNPSLVEVKAKYFDLSKVMIGTETMMGNYATFMSCTSLTLIEDIGLPANHNYDFAFYNCGKLETIEKITVAETTHFDRTFGLCKSLKNLTVSGKIGTNGFDVSVCPLTHDSLMSIVNALADKTGVSGTWKITLGTTNLGKLSDAEKQSIAAKGWTYA